MRHLLTSVGATVAASLVAQTFQALPAGQVDLAKALAMEDSCVKSVGAFELSDIITTAEYQAFIDYFYALSDSNSFATGPVPLKTGPRNGNSPMTRVSWTQAMAYCDWLAGRKENQGWKFRLPLLSEWLYARQLKQIGSAELGTWLMNAKDEAAWDCANFDYLYAAGMGDSFATRRKMVVYERSKHPAFGTGENYWQDIAYPNVGFRVVRYR